MFALNDHYISNNSTFSLIKVSDKTQELVLETTNLDSSPEIGGGFGGADNLNHESPMLNENEITTDAHTVCKESVYIRRSLHIRKKAGHDLGISLCRFGGSIFVADVYEGTTAWNCGLQIGDKIESVNNVVIPMRVSTNDLIATMRKFAELVLTIQDSPLVVRCELKAKNNCFSRISSKKIINLGFEVHNGQKVKPGQIPGKNTIVCVNGIWVLGNSDESIMNTISRYAMTQGKVKITSMPSSFAQKVALCIKRRPRAFSIKSRPELFIY